MENDSIDRIKRNYKGMKCRFLYNQTFNGALIVIEEIETKYQHCVWRHDWEDADWL